MRNSILALSLLFIGTGTSFGQNTGGLRFLEIGADPLSLAMSEAKTAVLLGAPSMFSNPANLALDQNSSLSATHTFWVSDTRNIQGAVNFRSGNNAFAFGVYTSVIEDLQARSVPGRPNGAFSWQYYAFAASYARNMGPISLGATGMYLYEQVYLSSARGFAFNAGATTSLLDNRVRVAAAATSIGKMDPLNASRSEVPGRIKVGTEIEAIQFSVDGSTEIPIVISLAGDFVKPVEWIDQEQSPFQDVLSGFVPPTDAPWFNGALRADIANLLNLRVGYTTNDTSRPFSIGAGVRRFGVDADFAFVPFNDGFGSSVSFGLRYSLN
jgi:hypothetical protein